MKKIFGVLLIDLYDEKLTRETKTVNLLENTRYNNKPHKERKGDATIKIFSNSGQGHVCRTEQKGNWVIKPF